MKKLYENPLCNIESFSAEDILTLSGGDLTQTVWLELDWSADADWQ